MLDSPFEVVPNPEEEAQQIEEIAKLTVELLDMRYENQRILRGVHPKSHGCVKAFFEIREDVPQDLQVGLFSRPGARYEAWVRYSNASVRVAHDREDDKEGSRGMAIKVMGVEGDVLNTDEGRNSQDFLMINQPAFAFANVKDYLRLTQIIREDNDEAGRFFAPLTPPHPDGFTPEDLARIGATGKAIKTLQAIPVAEPQTVSYFGAAPFLFGPDRVMHFSAEPWGGDRPQALPKDPSENYLGEALRERMERKDDVCFDFKVQVRGPGDGDLGIENAHTVWDEAEAPWTNVARLIIPSPQKRIGSRKKKEHCEGLVFTPWHCLPEHQPIGGINRLRKAVYVASAEHRKA